LKKYPVFFDVSSYQILKKHSHILRQRISTHPLISTTPLLVPVVNIPQIKAWDVYMSGCYKLDSKVDPDFLPFTRRPFLTEIAIKNVYNFFYQRFKKIPKKGFLGENNPPLPLV
jgi:hypothetical protein